MIIRHNWYRSDWAGGRAAGHEWWKARCHHPFSPHRDPHPWFVCSPLKGSTQQFRGVCKRIRPSKILHILLTTLLSPKSLYPHMHYCHTAENYKTSIQLPPNLPCDLVRWKEIKITNVIVLARTMLQQNCDISQLQWFLSLSVSATAVHCTILSKKGECLWSKQS